MSPGGCDLARGSSSVNGSMYRRMVIFIKSIYLQNLHPSIPTCAIQGHGDPDLVQEGICYYRQVISHDGLPSNQGGVISYILVMVR